MRLQVAGIIVLLASTHAALAVDPVVGHPTNDTERLGGRLFNQECRVCHGVNTLNATPDAPALSQATLGGDLDTIKAVITNGTASSGGRMPAWRYRFSPDEINAIALYVKTIPAAVEATAAPASKSAGPAVRE